MRHRLAALVILAATGAQAADLVTKKDPAPPPAPATPFFDYAFGGKLMTDYINRGVTQSDHNPAATAYGELRINPADWLQVYGGAQVWTVKLPTNPAAEVDIFAGVRPTVGPVSFDFGVIGYTYPRNTTQYFVDAAGLTTLSAAAGGVPTTARNPSFYEVYGKASYTWNDFLTFGANLYYSPNWTNVGAHATYVSGTLKIALPKDFAISGEFGRQYLGTSKALYGPTKYISYNTWNVGVSYTYKVATFDVRYSGTNLNKTECYINSSDPAGNALGQVASFRSNWCGHRVMATLSIDITSKDLK